MIPPPALLLSVISRCPLLVLYFVLLLKFFACLKWEKLSELLPRRAAHWEKISLHLRFITHGLKMLTAWVIPNIRHNEQLSGLFIMAFPSFPINKDCKTQRGWWGWSTANPYQADIYRPQTGSLAISHRMKCHRVHIPRDHQCTIDLVYRSIIPSWS